MSAASSPAATVHTGDLRYILVTQNLGAIDASAAGVTTEDIRVMVDKFVVSMGAFLRALAADMHSKGARGGSAFGDSTTIACVGDTTVGCPVDAFDVVVLHLQEIGGKKRSETLMNMLSEAVHRIYPNAGWCSGLLMNMDDCVDTFTAMGAVIFVSKRIVDITSILSFKRNRTFVALSDDPVSYVSSEADGNIKKDSLFAGKKFTDAGTSRKGYMLTSLRIGTQIINLINIHMFHDDDNRIAVKASPSEYALRRVRAWTEAITDILPLINAKDPCFVLGDLNTRLDGQRLVEFAKSTFNFPPIIAKKGVDRNAAFWNYVVQPKNVGHMLSFDCEVSTLLNVAGQHGIELGELPIQFPPTFSKEEYLEERDTENADAPIGDQQYSQMDPATGTYRLERVSRSNSNERLPAFCDRVLFNPEGLQMISGQYAANATEGALRPNVWKLYQYNSTVFDSTDHDCVYMAF